MSEIKNFTRQRERILFAIDGDEFESASAIPAGILAQFGSRYEGTNESKGLDETFELLLGALELVLLEDSYAKLRDRLNDRAHPVDLDQLNEIIEWLLEKYGLRPTRQSSDSADGPPSPDAGTNSTDATPAEESTSPPSLPIAS